MSFSLVAKEDASKRKPSWRESQRPGKLPPRNRSEVHPRVRGCRDVRVVPSAAATCIWISPSWWEACMRVSWFCSTTAYCVVKGVDNFPWTGVGRSVSKSREARSGNEVEPLMRSWTSGLMSSWVHACCCVWLFITLWTVTHQVPLSMGFPRQEYWSGLPLPSPGDLPDPGTEHMSLALAGGFFATELPGKPYITM